MMPIQNIFKRKKKVLEKLERFLFTVMQSVNELCNWKCVSTDLSGERGEMTPLGTFVSDSEQLLLFTIIFNCCFLRCLCE